MRKMAEILWQHLKRVSFMKKRLIRIREKMKLLYPGEQVERTVDVFYADTIRLLIKVMFWGMLMLAMVLVYELCLEETNVISVKRNEYGEGTRYVDLIGSSQNGVVAISRMEVQERQYTEQEINALYESAVDVLSEIIAGDNVSLEEITTSLTLPEVIEGFPFSISWKSSDVNVISNAGTLQNYFLEQEVDVRLSATLRYEEFEETAEWDVTVAPSMWTEQQIWQWAVENSLQEVESEDLKSREIGLPDLIRGENVTWQIKGGSAAVELAGLIVLCLILVVWGRDYDLKQKIKQRNRNLEEEYNAVVTRLLLYLGTGLPIKHAWEKTTSVLERINPESIAAREMKLAGREMNSGIYEKDCYISFGKRCGRQEYIRLGTLLSQNLKKGNSELLKRLREEAKESGEKQKHLVRRRGEETTTKLLGPMMMLLAVTMILIMLPAFMGIN